MARNKVQAAVGKILFGIGITFIATLIMFSLLDFIPFWFIAIIFIAMGLLLIGRKR